MIQKDQLTSYQTSLSLTTVTPHISFQMSLHLETKTLDVEHPTMKQESKQKTKNLQSRDDRDHLITFDYV